MFIPPFSMLFTVPAHILTIAHRQAVQPQLTA
jgi:hypothetical protein